MNGSDWIWILMMFFCFVLGGGLGADDGRRDMRKEAVEVGVAKVVCDQKTGASTFFWVVGTNNVISKYNLE